MPLKSRYSINSTGNVTYGDNVVMSIIKLAVQEIKGVVSLAGKGVRTSRGQNAINVDVSIFVSEGVSCSDVAFRIQENIKRSVESMTAFKIGVVNVNIMGLTLTEAPQVNS